MQRKKLFLVLSLVAMVAASFGFYGLNDDPKSTAVGLYDVTQSPVFNNNNQTDLAGSWVAGANALKGRYATGGVSYTRNDTAWLFFITGDTSGSGNMTSRNERYNINTNTWTSMAGVPTPLDGYGYARIKDSIYTIGGFTEGAFFTGTTAIVQKYDINANTWTTRAPYPGGQVGWCAAVGYQDSVMYAIGGFNAGGSNSQNAVYLYNALNNTWRAGTPLPAALTGGGCTITGDTIVYVGGATSFAGPYVNTVYRGVISQSNRSTITWTTGTPYPGQNRWRWDANPWGCKGIILTTGCTSGFTIGPGETYTYSPGANTWTAQANLPVPTASASVGSVRYNSGVWKLVVASGLILSAPFSILNTQVFSDTLCPAPAPVGIQTTVCRNGLNVIIPDNLPVGAKDSISMPTTWGCTILDVNVKIDTLLHTYDSDLTFDLTHGATTVRIINAVGTSFDNFIGTNLNDSASTPIASGVAPFTGTFQPSSPLSAFNTSSTNGSWVLLIVDHAALDTGSLKAWCVSVTYQCPVGGIQTVEVPNVYKLNQNYPNPFNPSTTISYGLPKSGNVSLVVYDILGREVKTLVNEFKNQGTYNVSFDASSFASGVYFYTLKANDFTSTKKMLLVK